ncbi:hypothetical protein [Vibrio sp. Of7-15]|uniref:hypothetical protein n=1 Tax=Vibrio sp. Of7-15 TaxID=2724879 RepID=UPI001EF28ED7|nr:hypothetical protein [Vibrio sp. Of7-15]
MFKLALIPLFSGGLLWLVIFLCAPNAETAYGNIVSFSSVYYFPEKRHFINVSLKNQPNEIIKLPLPKNHACIASSSIELTKRFCVIRQRSLYHFRHCSPVESNISFLPLPVQNPKPNL